MNVKGTKKKNQVVTANIFEQQELLKKAEVIAAPDPVDVWAFVAAHVPVARHSVFCQEPVYQETAEKEVGECCRTARHIIWN